jgi:hypothetical protein
MKTNASKMINYCKQLDRRRRKRPSLWKVRKETYLAGVKQEAQKYEEWNTDVCFAKRTSRQAASNI